MTASPNEAGCWCASESKCPHSISSKLLSSWDEVERAVDEVIQQFDQSSIIRFLKRDLDGNLLHSVGRVKEVLVLSSLF